MDKVLSMVVLGAGAVMVGSVVLVLVAGLLSWHKPTLHRWIDKIP
jgi:hypothetical protein